MQHQRLILSVLALGLVGGLAAGCASDPEWQKAGATRAERHQAIANCRVMADRADDDDVFDDCMKGKGFFED